MREFTADLHIHSPYSIGVSRNMTLENIAECARQKGIDIVGTGDVLQPDWSKHLQSRLVSERDELSFGGINFLLTVEIEDSESIHHLVILRDFEAVGRLRNALHRCSTNVTDRWGGRPRVNIGGAELAGLCRDDDGLIGPAHAFTPFKSIFREGRHESLMSCYGNEAPYVSFIELGLSADTEMADSISELSRVTFVTSSDAHSPSPAKLGREFMRLAMESATFDELAQALRREGGRRTVLNVGLDPRLGKYYLSFCSSCRRTLVIDEGEISPSFDSLDIHVSVRGQSELAQLLRSIHERRVACPACGRRLRLGVKDRAMMIGEHESVSPAHRPPYLHIPPLLELISSAHGFKAASSSANRLYSTLVKACGAEVTIITETSIEAIRAVDPALSELIAAYRAGAVRYRPGGGGRYGKVLGLGEA